MKAFVTDHAIERFRERCHPALYPWEARMLLYHRVEEAVEPVLGPGSTARAVEIDLGSGVTGVVRRVGSRWVLTTCWRDDSPNTAMADALLAQGITPESCT